MCREEEMRRVEGGHVKKFGGVRRRTAGVQWLVGSVGVKTLEWGLSLQKLWLCRVRKRQLHEERCRWAFLTSFRWNECRREVHRGSPPVKYLNDVVWDLASMQNEWSE